jgi:hypothetical protein
MKEKSLQELKNEKILLEARNFELEETEITQKKDGVQQ